VFYANMLQTIAPPSKYHYIEGCVRVEPTLFQFAYERRPAATPHVRISPKGRERKPLLWLNVASHCEKTHESAPSRLTPKIELAKLADINGLGPPTRGSRTAPLIRIAE
jgi:hypothetical protein